jgi:hypothetical protein
MPDIVGLSITIGLTIALFRLHYFKHSKRTNISIVLLLIFQFWMIFAWMTGRSIFSIFNINGISESIEMSGEEALNRAVRFQDNEFSSDTIKIDRLQLWARKGTDFIIFNERYRFHHIYD